MVKIAKNGPSCKADLSTTVQERWSLIDEEHCCVICKVLKEFKLSSKPEELQDFIVCDTVFLYFILIKTVKSYFHFQVNFTKPECLAGELIN